MISTVILNSGNIYSKLNWLVAVQIYQIALSLAWMNLEEVSANVKMIAEYHQLKLTIIDITSKIWF